MDLGLRGRRAAVSAASSGLGLEIARALAAEGCQVTICGSDEQRITAAAAGLGDRVHPLVADLTDPLQAGDFVTEATTAMGGLDILVINTVGPRPGTFDVLSPADFAGALDATVMSTVRMCQSGVPVMRDQRFGRIIAVTSVSVRQPIPTLMLSNTARTGATAFLKSLATEVAGDGITVNSLQPGLHATKRVHQVYGDALEAELAGIPAGELGRPEDFGAVAAFLASDQARYITGAAIQVDGGYCSGLL